MAQLSELQVAPPSDIRQRTVQIIGILLTAIIILAIYWFYLTLQAQVWQTIAVTAIQTVLAINLGGGIFLARKGQVTTAAWLMLVSLLAALFLSTGLVSGIGIIQAILAFLLTVMVAPILLPERQAGLAIGAGVVTAIGIILIEANGENLNRFLIPETAQTVLPVVSGVLVLVYLFYMLRQFGDYPLRTKLIVSFLAVSALSVGSGIFFMSRSVNEITINNVGSNLNSLATSQALSIGELLIRQVDRLQALSLNKILQDQLEILSDSYGEDEVSIRERLLLLDEQWQSVSTEDSLIQSRLTNNLALELKEYQLSFPDHVEVFVTDRYGALVAATARTSDFYQADENWWQNAFNNGQGAVHIGQPTFDESSQSFSVIVAIPMRARVSGEVIGVLRSTYQLANLQFLLDATRAQDKGHADLYMPDGRALSAESSNLEMIDAETLTNLRANVSRQYAIINYEGESSMVSQARVRSISGDQVLTRLGWTLVVHTPAGSALAPVQSRTNTAVFLALAIVGGAALVGVGMAQLLTNPIIRLTAGASAVAAGNLNVQVQAESKDEIGQLAQAFNAMTTKLRQTLDRLEGRVTDRTRQLETLVEITQNLAGILDLSDLLRQVVNLTKETFNYYHVHIYLLDDRLETLIMAEGYGEAGAQMKMQGHNISLSSSKSLVARAAREGQTITVENVRDDPDWLPNPLLPETQSEMAVPVMLGNQVVGVMDVQSNRVNGLTPQDESAMSALANQVAVAVRNARLFTETQDALYEAQRLQQIYTGQAWERLVSSHPTDYQVALADPLAFRNVTTPEASAALEQKQTITMKFPGAANGQEQESTGNPIRTALATPLKLRDQIVGVLGIHTDDAQREWNREEIALIEAVSEQMSLALENARLFEESQRSAWRDQMVSESTAKVWSSSELEEVLRTAVMQLSDKLHASEVIIRLGTEAELAAETEING